MNKKGGLSDVFLFMIVAICIVFISGIFIYIGLQAEDKLHETMDDMDFKVANATQVIDDTFGQVNTAYNSLYWISIMLIIGMVISIFIGSYLVTTKPIFFIPYIFVTIIAFFVAVGLSNAYGEVILDPVLATTFAGFIGANFILSHLPIWVVVIGIVGAIIMFVKMGSRENDVGLQYG